MAEASPVAAERCSKPTPTFASGIGMRIGRRVVLASAMVACHGAIAGSTVYQWEDETGQIHFSDTVPDKYKRTARRVDTARSEITPEQARAARAQADALKAQAARTSSSAPVVASRPPRTPVPAARAAAGGQAPDLGDCAAWRSAFLASRDCYAGYQTKYGPLRQGASEACGPEVPNPEPKCGSEP